MTMSEPLFYIPEEFVVKTAGEVDLPDDPNQWAQSILQELYKQVPYITDYQPHVSMERVDAERGYGLGHVEIQNQTEAPMDADPAAMEATGIRTVRIPFIVREKKLSPFDLLVNDLGKIIPLTENRLRQALFRPQAFDVTSRTPGDQSMIGQLYPPYRQNYGFGGGGISMNAGGGMGLGKTSSALEQYLSASPAPLTKQASATKSRLMDKVAARSVKLGHASILESILPTITRADQQRFADELSKEASYLFATSRSSCVGFNHILSSILDATPEQVKEGSWRAWTRPSVVQVRRSSDGYVVKTASHTMWEPELERIDRGEVVRRFGVKVAMEADTTGSATLAEGATAVGDEKENHLEEVTEPGAYKVMDSNGKEHIGAVIPQLVDMDGELTPIALFTNGTVVAVQGDIFGERSGDLQNLPSGPVGKNGCFYTQTEEGIRMTIPFEFRDSYSFGDQPKVLSGVTFDGRPAEVSIQPNIVDVTPVDSDRILIPMTWKWLPLDGVEGISIVSSEEAEAFDEVEEEKQGCVRVVSDGMSFTFRGLPVTKLAAADLQWLSLDDAMFLLSGLGVEPGYGAQKLAEAAAFKKEAKVRIGRLIQPLSGHVKEAQARAREIVDSMADFKQPLLLKEAATFPDPTTVDTVLSLGFINPENIMTFVSYLPDLEGVQTKLCELLFSVRLGLKSLPQASLERAVRSLEETIEGLKVLGFQGS